MKFIKDRLNKDNFWNLMFFLGMTFGMSLVDLFSNFIPVLALSFFICSLILTPYLLVKINGVQYKQDDKLFINKQNRVLNPIYCKYFGLISILNIPVSVTIFFIVDKNFLIIKDMICVYTFVFLASPVLYFIIINCPITILFNKNTWVQKVSGFNGHARHIHNLHSSIINHKSHSSLSPNDWSTSPAYKNLSSNIHYKR